MSALSEAVDQYLALRRGLGAKLLGVDRILHSFTDFADQEKTSHITTDLVLRWVEAQRGVIPATRAFRFQLVRKFALWRSATDPRTEIPPKGLLPGRYRRKAPYIYSDSEIEQLIQAARRLPPPTALKGDTYATIFALLSVTGMRVSEVLALDREDVMLEEGMLRIRRSKFGKSRLVPLHPSTSKALAAYARRRERMIRQPLDSAFFLSDRGLRVKGCSTRYNFARISQQLGLRDAPTGMGRHGWGPRLHDMRHRFASKTLLDWYRAGVDVEREIPKLSTYLGHTHVNDTYWYIEAVPELLELATRRLVGRQRRARSILGKTSRRIAQAFGIIRSDFKAAALQIIPLEAVNLREQVNETIGAQLMNRGLSNQAARALVADITVEGATVNEQFGRQAATTLNGVSDAVMASVRRGSHLGQLVAAIKGTAALNYQDGLFRAYDRQTRTLLLTAMANAVNSARHDVYKRHSELLEGLQAINPLDGSTATICKARAGRWWKNDGRPGPNTGEPFPGHPPWHFGCRTTLIPVLKSYSRMMRSRDLTQGQRKELQQLSLARQVALNGNPAKGQTFDQLLRSKSPKRRRELLGPGRAKMWADGDIGMTDLIDQSGRPMTILSLQQKAGIDTP